MQLLLYHGSRRTELGQMVSALVWSGDKSRAARTLQFALLKSPLDAHLPAVDCANGDHVELLDGSGRSRFFGMVVQCSAATPSPSVQAVAYDRGIYLANNDGTYHFDTTPEAAVAQICRDYAIPLGAAAATGVRVRRKFSAVALWQIIAAMYGKAGEQNGKRYMARFLGRELQVVERTAGETNLVIRPGSNLFSAETARSILELRNSVAIYDKDGRRLGLVEDAAAKALYGLMQKHITQKDGEDAAAEARALLADSGEAQSVRVTALGDFNVIAGETVVVRQPDAGLQGIFWVDADTHKFANGLHTMELSLNVRNVAYTTTAGRAWD